MDLRFTPEMEGFREEVRSFLTKHRDRYVGDAARPREAALEWQRLLIEHGYAARTIPTAYGGYGNPYGYADPRYAPTGDLSFRCTVDYRGYVSNLRVERNGTYRPY